MQHGQPGIEIERKWRLREAPPAEALHAREEDRWRVEQVYLTRGDDGFHRRIRRIEHADGSVEHVLTRKASMGDGTIARRELEESLDEHEYGALLAEADPSRRPIRKTRHVVPHGDRVLEIDVFDVPPGLVVAEVELGSVDEPVELPDWLGEAVEVTEDAAFYNASLATRGATVPAWDDRRAGR